MIRTAKFARFYRLIVALLGWSALIILWYAAVVDRDAGTSIFSAIVATFRYFTVQSNLLVAIWLLTAVIYWDRGRQPRFLRPIFKGAFTVYISVTFLVFAIVLAPLVNPQGLAVYTNAITHYVTPIAFIIDWLLFEQLRSYQWRLALIWLVYPAAYLIFALSFGTLTGDYIYPFLNFPELGSSGLARWVAILISLFIFLGVLYIGVNRVWGTRESAL